MTEGKIKVIIADDNKNFVDALYEYLNTQEDVEIVGIAQNGLEAWEQISQRNPDIVLLDIIMPAIDGISILERFNTANNAHRPIFIIISSMGQKKMTQRAISLGAEYVFSKPCDLEYILKIIRQIYHHKK